MGKVSPLRRRMIEDIGSQSLTGNAAILPLRGQQVQPLL